MYFHVLDILIPFSSVPRSANKPFNLERYPAVLISIKIFLSARTPCPPYIFIHNNRDIREDQKDSYSLERSDVDLVVHDESKREAFNSSVNKSAKREGRRFVSLLSPFSKKKKKRGKKSYSVYHFSSGPRPDRHPPPFPSRFPQRPEPFGSYVDMIITFLRSWEPGSSENPGGKGGMEVMLFRKLFEECSRNLTIPSPRL